MSDAVHPNHQDLAMSYDTLGHPDTFLKTNYRWVPMTFNFSGYSCLQTEIVPNAYKLLLHSRKSNPALVDTYL